MRQALTEALIEFEGAIVVVSHDRHLLRSTTDDLYLVHDGQVEPFDGDLDDYQRWLADSQKQMRQSAEPAAENGEEKNTVTAQDRKEQKRREAEFRQQTQPLRKESEKLEKTMSRLSDAIAVIEEKLGDSGLYDQSRKAELNTCLQEQAQFKAELEEAEMAWMEIQENLEAMTQAFENQ